MKRYVLLLSLFVFSASAQDSQRCAFRIVVLDYSRNIDSAWLAPAHLSGVPEVKREAGNSPSSRRADGKLKLSRANFSTSWLLANVLDGKLIFYDSEPVPGAGPPPVVARAKFEGAVPRLAYLLLIPDSEGEIPYRVVAIDAGTSSFPAATHLVINLTADSVRGIFGDQNFQVRTERMHLVPPVGETNPRGYFKVYLDHGDGIEWKRIAWTQWKADPTAQRICLVYRNGPRIAVRTLNQFVKGIAASEMPEDTRDPIKPGTAPENPPE